MATAFQTTKTPATPRLSKGAKAKLTARAAESGQSIGTIASVLIEQAVGRLTVEEALAPYRKQVADSGMTDAELDGVHRRLLSEVRSEKRASSR